jgi:signal transduction histidine kinase
MSIPAPKGHPSVHPLLERVVERPAAGSSPAAHREQPTPRLHDVQPDYGRLFASMCEQDARKDEFLATLGHELRNPLASLRSGLRLLDRTGTDPAARDRAHAMMERQVDLLVRLTDDLLDVQRVKHGKIVLRRAPVAVADVVQRAAEISQPSIDRGGHELVLELPREPIVVDADEVRLAQALSNLLSNAVLAWATAASSSSTSRWTPYRRKTCRSSPCPSARRRRRTCRAGTHRVGAS